MTKPASHTALRIRIHSKNLQLLSTKKFNNWSLSSKIWYKRLNNK